MFPKDKDFIDPLSDFGFKNLFGKEGKAKDNLIVLLNAILHETLGFDRIVDLNLIYRDNQGENPDWKTSVFDIHCYTSTNHRIIVEMQNRWEANFKDRMLYYAVVALMRQAFRNEDGRTWDYKFDPVVSLAFCNFQLPGNERKVAYYLMRERDTGREFGRQLNLVFVDLPKFTDEIEKCVTTLEQIIYSLKNMKTIQGMEKVPFSKEQGDFFDTIALMSRVSALSPEEKMAYDRWWIHENDRRLREQRIHDESYEQGIEQGKWEMAKNLYAMGMDLNSISKASEIPVEILRERLK